MPFKVHGEVSRTNPTSPKNRPTRTAARAGFPFEVDPMFVSLKQFLNVLLGVSFSVKMKSRIR